MSFLAHIKKYITFQRFYQSYSGNILTHGLTCFPAYHLADSCINGEGVADNTCDYSKKHYIAGL
jgi:hypothetical protein